MPNTLIVQVEGHGELFLFQFKLGRHLPVTSRAVITICALAIDPFSQYVLKYQNCLESLASATARIAWPTNYSTAGLHAAGGISSLDSIMTPSIYNGLLFSAENVSSLVFGTCPSGDYTLTSGNGASYSPIQICQKSQNISRHLSNYSDPF